MAENEMERAVRMAAAFPNHNRERPVSPFQVMQAFRDELPIVGWPVVVLDVVKLVNERPADPFEGIA